MRLRAVVAELGHGDVGKIQCPPIAVSLVFEVVNGEYGGGATYGRVLEGRVEEQGNETGGPIVTMHHVGNPTELLTECE